MIASDEDGYESVDTLVVTSLKTEKSYVMEQGWSYHLYPRK